MNFSFPPPGRGGPPGPPPSDFSFRGNARGVLSQNARDILSGKGINTESIKAVLVSDRGRDGELCDCNVILTDEAVAVLSVREELKAAPGGHFAPFSRKKPIPVTAQTDWAWFNREEFCGFYIEERRTGGILWAKTKEGSAEILCGFSMAKKSACEEFLLSLNGEGAINRQPAAAERDLRKKCCPKCHSPYPDPNNPVCVHCAPSVKLFRRLFPFFKRYLFGIIVTVFFIALGIVSGIAIPYLSNQVLYDRVLNPDGDLYGMIGMITLVIVAVNLLTAFFEHINSVVSSRISARVIYDLKKTIFENLQRLSMSFFTGRQTGSLMTQVNSDAETLYWFFCDGVPYLITNLAKLVGVAAVMFWLDWRLALFVIVPAPFLALFYRAVMKSFSRLHARSFARSRRFNSAVSDVIGGFRVVKAFGREDGEIEDFDLKSRSYAKANLAVSLRANFVFPAVSLSISLGTLAVWAVGGWLVVKNGLGQNGVSYATLMTFISVLSFLSGPISFLGEFSGHLARAVNSMRRLFEVMDAVPEITEKPDAVKKDVFDGDVSFENVSFSYEPGRKTLDNISFHISPGETLGIVGHTGAGKSTIANLMTRLYDALSGSVKIDGVDVRDLSLDSLRKNVAIVSQETYLFRGTVMDNIRYACPDATREDVIRAARAAGAHEFIMKLENGYNSVIDSQKNRLSGGETQRISIARAILKNPRILILDEATASMDTQTERQIQESLDALTKGKTTVIIAHRLSTLRNADMLAVINNGKLTEIGTHADLMIKDGEYRRLYTLQLEALKRVAVD